MAPTVHPLAGFACKPGQYWEPRNSSCVDDLPIEAKGLKPSTCPRSFLLRGRMTTHSYTRKAGKTPKGEGPGSRYSPPALTKDKEVSALFFEITEQTADSLRVSFKFNDYVLARVPGPGNR